MSSSSSRVSSASSRSISSRAIARSSSSASAVAHLAGAGELVAGGLQAAERLHDRLEPGQLLAEPSQLRRVASRSRAAPARPGGRRIGGRPPPAWRRGQLRRRVARSAGRRRRWRAGGVVRLGRVERLRSGSWPSRLGTVSPSAAQRLLHRHDRDLDHVVGRLLGRDLLDQHARVEQHPHDRVGAMRAPEPQDLVADRGDDRDQQDPAADHHQRRLPADQAERDDRQEDDHDQELGAAALVGGRVLADLGRGQRVAGLERVDRHVLGAVVLEDPPDVRGARDQHQVAEEDRDPDQPLDEVLDQAVLDVGRS